MNIFRNPSVRPFSKHGIIYERKQNTHQKNLHFLLAEAESLPGIGVMPQAILGLRFPAAGALHLKPCSCPFQSFLQLRNGAIKGAAIKCMASPRRVKMVAKQIRRELSDMLLTDTALQYAILPEASLGADRYLSSLTTISDVEVSGDLQVVKVYVSVFGDERGKEIAIAGLKSKAKYVRSELGKRMKLRLTPEIRFIEDESLERGSRVIAILDKIKAEKESAEVQDAGKPESSYKSEDDTDWNEDDTDEDVIYVK